jgi:hypothetical protein
VKVAKIGKHRAVRRASPGIRDGRALPVWAVRIEPDELNALRIRPFQGELGAAQHLAARLSRRAG